jgi:FkbM family methyltransferase
MFENIINRILRKTGFQVSRINTLERQIKNGEFKWLQDFGIKTVLDVGANIGWFTNMMCTVLPESRIYAFEPLCDCFKNLVNNTQQNTQVKCFNVALGSETKDAIINKNEFSPSSSLLKMNKIHKRLFPYTQLESAEKIRVVTFESLIDEIELSKKVLLKIDVQGFEIEVLKGMGSLLKEIDLIIVETSFVELYNNQPLFGEVYSFLTSKKFNYIGNFDQMINPKTGLILQADSIFIRNDFNLSTK